MAEFSVDRSTGTLNFTEYYSTSGTFFFEYEPPIVTFNSFWDLGLAEVGGPVVRNFGGGDDNPSTTVGPINIGLDPTSAVRTYSLVFESFPDSSDAISTGLGYWDIQSAAYLTTAVTLDGNETGTHPFYFAADVLIGGSAGDTLRGLSGDDFLDGGAGNDLLEGGDSNDDLYGVDGNDMLAGGAGNDRLFGGAGNDALNGGDGNDTLNGGTGIDTLTGGAGNDSYVADPQDIFVETVDGGTDTILSALNASTLGLNFENLTRTGNASFRGYGNAAANIITGGGGTDILDGGVGNDTLNGGAGNDTLIGGLGADALKGGDGSDTASYEVAATAISVNLLTGVTAGNAAAGDTFASVENVKGTSFNDLIRGDAAANTITGNGGNDDIRGGAGNDVLLGGAGNDRVIGEAGNDRLSGGDGDDIFYLGGGGGRDTVTDFVAGAGSGDVLRIGPGLAFESFEAVMAVASQSGANTIIRLDANTSVTLLNVTAASLEANDFLFA